MHAHQSHVEVTAGSEKGFGLVWGVVLVCLAVYFLAGTHDFTAAALLFIAFILLCISLIKPEWLAAPNRLWFKFGMFLGGFVAPIIMALLYVLAIVPTGLVMKMFNKDLIGREPDPMATTYWVKRKEPMGPMGNQF